MADKITLRRVLRLYLFYAKMDLSWVLRDARYAFFGILADFIMNLSAIGGVFLLSVRFNGVGGMNGDEVLFMLGYGTVATGIYLMFFSNGNVGLISRVIGRGQFDHKLLEPLPLKIQLMTEGFAPVSGSGNFIAGIVLVAAALFRLKVHISVWWAVLLVFSLITTTVITLAELYLCSSLAFWAPVAAEEISSYVGDLNWALSNYPLSGMPVWLRGVLITVLPAGLCAWFPALALLGRSPFGLTLVYPAAVAGVFTTIAVFFFQKGLRHYEKIGSQRYKDLGHRR